MPAEARSIKVSVVVPVYNPGRFIEPCIRSALGQTMSPQDYEVIFVDDGSTDGTAELLDRLAREHGNVRVIHTPRSGGPSAPRNIGIAEARGQYIQFLDADDELAIDALERLYGLARRTAADVVVPKVASASIRRRPNLFRRDRSGVTLRQAPELIDSSLGPAKLFRRDFVTEQGLRFPEGWRRIEDQYFTVGAYLRARRITVAADAPYYFYRKRDDAGHLTSEALEPRSYYANLRAIFERIEAETRPGELRTRLIRRFYRTEMLSRVSEPKFLGYGPEQRRAVFESVRDLARDHVDERVHASLGALGRVRSRLLREDREDALVALARRVSELDLRTELRSQRWGDGRLHLALDAHFQRGDPVVIIRSAGRTVLDPSISEGLTPPEPVDLTRPRDAFQADIILRDPHTALEWLVPTGLSIRLVPQAAVGGELRLNPIVRLRATIDPLRVGPRRTALTDGRWEIWLRLRGLGIDRYRVLDDGPAATDLETPMIVGRPPRLVALSRDGGRLTLDVGPIARLGAVVREGTVRVMGDGRRVVLMLPVASGPGVAREPVELIVRAHGEERTLPARLGPFGGLATVSASVHSVQPLPIGQVELRARFGGSGGTDLLIGTAVCTEDGRVRLPGLPRVGLDERVVLTARAAVRVVLRAARAQARALYDRLPGVVRSRLRKLVRSIAR
jgi:glycosyltransferase involved in cell wall biosynthesis